MPPDFDRFFLDYVEAYNRSLAGAVDARAIRACFADCFVGAGPGGVTCGRNDQSFTAALENIYDFYRAIGTRRMAVRVVEVTPIDEIHHMARVGYTAHYDRPAGGRANSGPEAVPGGITARDDLTIEFDVIYMMQTVEGRSRIFAFVSGDEMAVYRRHGLVDRETGRPSRRPLSTRAGTGP